MSCVLSPISARATTANELQSAVIAAMIPPGARKRSGLGRCEKRGEVPHVLERVHRFHRLHDLVGAAVAKRTRGEGEELRHHLLGGYGIGRVSADYPRGLGKRAAVPERDPHMEIGR